MGTRYTKLALLREEKNKSPMARSSPAKVKTSFTLHRTIHALALAASSHWGIEEKLSIDGKGLMSQWVSRVIHDAAIYELGEEAVRKILARERTVRVKRSRPKS